MRVNSYSGWKCHLKGKAGEDFTLKAKEACRELVTFCARALIAVLPFKPVFNSHNKSIVAQL
jgi:hypothetical protein